MLPPIRRVLVVDDDVAVVAMVSEALRQHGLEIGTAGEGREALKLIRQGGFQICLLDIRLPDVDGLFVLRQIKSWALPTHVIMMSAYGDVALATAAIDLGALDYLPKPFRAEDAVLRIRMAQRRLGTQEQRPATATASAVDATSSTGSRSIIGQSAALQGVLHVVRKVAAFDTTVLVLGESGTGKELIARLLHEQSHRAGAFVAINCGAVPANLLESELFGHLRGAFTDATRDKPGLAEEADGGTLFLDEIGELPLDLQVKLLRFLQEGEVRRVGANLGTKVDVRVVAATSKDLQAMVREKTFRDDLFYRLNVISLELPPLRERKDDLPMLVTHFVSRAGARLGGKPFTVSLAAMAFLVNYHWPGNIRELENTIERAVVLCEGDVIGVESLPERVRQDLVPEPLELSWLGSSLSIKRAAKALERELIRRSLEQTHGNRTHAARLLEISHRALLYKIKDYGLS